MADALRQFLIEKVGLSEEQANQVVSSPLSLGSIYVAGKEVVIPVAKNLWKDLSPTAIRDIRNFAIVYAVSHKILWFAVTLILIFILVRCKCVSHRVATILSLFITFLTVVSMAVEVERILNLLSDLRSTVNAETIEASAVNTFKSIDKDKLQADLSGEVLYTNDQIVQRGTQPWTTGVLIPQAIDPNPSELYPDGGDIYHAIIEYGGGVSETAKEKPPS